MEIMELSMYCFLNLPDYKNQLGYILFLNTSFLGDSVSLGLVWESKILTSLLRDLYNFQVWEIKNTEIGMSKKIGK